MDIRKIKKLIELVEESGINELEISEGEESVRITRNTSANLAHAAAMVAPLVAAPVASSLIRFVASTRYCSNRSY